jgi:predicted DNA-binding antitoxin AbrB/MazE fold protein
MAKLGAKIVEAVFEDGVFRPMRAVALPERSRVRLTLVPLPARHAKERNRAVARQRKALLGIAGIGASGQAYISENPHRALYGTRRAR